VACASTGSGSRSKLDAFGCSSTRTTSRVDAHGIPRPGYSRPAESA
jgi:hypothetical protein